jgi:hypothetical protein
MIASEGATTMAIRTTALDEGTEEQPWCDHRDPGFEAPCRKGGIAVGGTGLDGRTPYVCTAGHHFSWPHEVPTPGTAPTTTR